VPRRCAGPGSAAVHRECRISVRTTVTGAPAWRLSADEAGLADAAPLFDIQLMRGLCSRAAGS
jgi:hypothetical protein